MPAFHLVQVASFRLGSGSGVASQRWLRERHRLRGRRGACTMASSRRASSNRAHNSSRASYSDAPGRKRRQRWPRTGGRGPVAAIVHESLATNGLVFPFESDTRQPAPATSDYRYGVITRWTSTSGFITEAGTGQSWFVSQDSTPGGSGMAAGTRVTFTDRHSPRPGKRYPEAFSATDAADH